jgi:hypothetical protein
MLIIAEDCLTRKCGSGSVCVNFIQSERGTPITPSQNTAAHVRAKNNCTPPWFFWRGLIPGAIDRAGAIIERSAACGSHRRGGERGADRGTVDEPHHAGAPLSVNQLYARYRGANPDRRDRELSPAEFLQKNAHRIRGIGPLLEIVAWLSKRINQLLGGGLRGV